MKRYCETDTLVEKYFHIHISTDKGKKLFFYPEISGYGEYTGDYFRGRTSFLHYELMLVVKGKIQLHTGHGDFQVNTSEACIIETKMPHHYEAYSKEKCNIFWLHFNGSLMNAYFAYIWERYKTQVFPVSELFSIEFETLIRNLASSHPYSEMEISARIMQLLSMLKTEEKSTVKGGIETVCHYLQENYAEKNTLHHMANMAHMSLSHFCYKFKELTGIAPYQYVLDLRLSAAYHNLFSTSDTIEQIAERVGFCSASSFIIAFKGKYGTTPTCVRKNAGEQIAQQNLPAK